MVFVHTDSRGPVDVAFTDRHGGDSEGPWSSLNLGTSSGDNPARVQRNLASVASCFGVRPEQMVRMSQRHGREVAVVDETTPLSGTDADALVTRTSGIALLVRVADCAPIVLADPDHWVVGVVHAGRRGMAANIVGASVAAMRRLGAQALTAWIGPRACGLCYEVSQQVHDQVTARVPDARSVTSWGTPALDIGAGLRAQLDSEQVTVIDLADHHLACTIEGRQYFSYRRQGSESGRLGALVRLRSQGEGSLRAERQRDTPVEFDG